MRRLCGKVRAQTVLIAVKGGHSGGLSFFGPGRCLTIQARESPPLDAQNGDLGSIHGVRVHTPPNEHRQLQRPSLTAWNLYCGYPV
jgi:hypothetical protein